MLSFSSPHQILTRSKSEVNSKTLISFLADAVSAVHLALTFPFFVAVFNLQRFP